MYDFDRRLRLPETKAEAVADGIGEGQTNQHIMF
jgi:hypothetical protein